MFKRLHYGFKRHRHHPDSFCFLCGEYINKGGRKISPWKDQQRLVKPTRSTLVCQLGTRTSPWPLTNVVSTVRRRWKVGCEVRKGPLHFATRLGSTDHSTNCFFCFVDVSTRRKGMNFCAVYYPDLTSLIAPVLTAPNILCPHNLLQMKSKASILMMRRWMQRNT